MTSTDEKHTPSGKDDDVRRELAPVLELDARLCETRDLAVVLELNLPVRDQLARSNVW